MTRVERAALSAPRAQALAAYALSTLATLVWVACVLPAGPLLNGVSDTDAATPMHREALLLVPALMLLVLLPVGITLAQQRRGALAVLASTDAFVALYAAATVALLLPFEDVATRVLIIVLTAVGLLSVIEALRCMRRTERRLRRRLLRGLRLACCLLVIMIPAKLLLEDGVDRASLLAPFLVIAVSAGGALMFHSTAALHATSGLIQIALATHVLVTVQYTLHDQTPAFQAIAWPGYVAWMLAGALVAAAVLQWGLLLAKARAPRSPDLASPTPETPHA